MNQSLPLISTARRRRLAIVNLLSGCECAIRYGGEAIRLERSVENNQARLEGWQRARCDGNLVTHAERFLRIEEMVAKVGR